MENSRNNEKEKENEYPLVPAPDKQTRLINQGNGCINLEPIFNETTALATNSVSRNGTGTENNSDSDEDDDSENEVEARKVQFDERHHNTITEFNMDMDTVDFVASTSSFVSEQAEPSHTTSATTYTINLGHRPRFDTGSYLGPIGNAGISIYDREQTNGNNDNNSNNNNNNANELVIELSENNSTYFGGMSRLAIPGTLETPHDHSSRENNSGRDISRRTPAYRPKSTFKENIVGSIVAAMNDSKKLEYFRDITKKDDVLQSRPLSELDNDMRWLVIKDYRFGLVVDHEVYSLEPPPSQNKNKNKNTNDGDNDNDNDNDKQLNASQKAEDITVTKREWCIIGLLLIQNSIQYGWYIVYLTDKYNLDIRHLSLLCMCLIIGRQIMTIIGEKMKNHSVIKRKYI